MATKTATAKKAATQKKSVTPKKTTASKSTASKSSPKTPAKSDAASDLKDFFEDALKDIYWAEKALTKALPKMEKKCYSSSIKRSYHNAFKRN